MGEEAKAMARASMIPGVHTSASWCGDREVEEGNDGVLLGLDRVRVVAVMVAETSGKEGHGISVSVGEGGTHLWVLL